jgi:hypothetical protein
MTDRELLELAAKAAGVIHPEVLAKHLASGWNPLTDDGDALRLAVKLGGMLEITIAGPTTQVLRGDMLAPAIETNLGDPCASTRRAIVRAAAEIGRERP